MKKFKQFLDYGFNNQFFSQSKFFILTLVVALSVSYYLFNSHNFLAQYADFGYPLWVASYMGEFFRNHHTFSMNINTDHFVGLIQPLFYGFGFFRFAGLLSSILGASLVFRIIFLFLFLLQAICVYRLFALLSLDKFLAFCVSALVSLAIYPLTNLYIRGAVAEFVATMLLVCGFCFLLKLLLLPKKQLFKDKWALGLCFAGALVTHPITFKYGITFTIISVLPLLPFINLKRFMQWSIPNVLFILIVVSPWLYLLLIKPTSNILLRWSNLGFPALTANIDTMWTRLQLYPFDGRALQQGIHIPTAYLGAQINMPLVLLDVILFLFCWNKTTWKDVVKRVYLILEINSLILFLLVLVLSVKAIPYLSAFLEQAQFGYRLITYVNLSALCFAASLTPFLNAENKLWKRWREILITCVMTIAVIGFMVQSAQIQLQIKKSIPEWSKPAGKGNRNQLLTRLPNEWEWPYPYFDYINTSVFNEKGQTNLNVSRKKIEIPVGHYKQFGETSPIVVNLKKKTLIETDVFPFPWNHIKLDGKFLPADQLMMNSDCRYRNELGLRFLIGPGTHIIEYKYIPDPNWRYLNMASMIAVLLWLLGYFMYTISSYTKRL